MDKYVFISHSSKDGGDAVKLCDYLEENGKKCFIAPRDIQYGHEYAEAIINGVDNSEAMVLMLSDNSNKSPHVLREVERAVSKSIPIIIYKLEEVELSKSMEYFLMTHQWISAAAEGGFEEILKYVNEISDRPLTDRNTEYTGNINDNNKKSNVKSQSMIAEELRLIEAVKTGNRALVKALIMKFNGNINRKDSSGKNVLFYACENGSLNMLEMLLDKGGDIDITDNEGDTLLHAAVKSGNKSVVKLLLFRGIYIDEKNNEGRTPLMIAAINSRADIAKYLVEQGADISLKDDNGNNAFKYAVAGGNKQLISLLMDESADEKSKNGNNALHMAVAAGSLEAVKAVVSENPDLMNERNDKGQTPIFIAAENNKYVIMKELADAGSDINLYDNDSRTILHISALYNNLASIKMLVEHNVEIDATDNNGNTPLLLAVENRNAECAYYLVECGADTKILNDEGKSVYDYAIKNKMAELIEML